MKELKKESSTAEADSEIIEKAEAKAKELSTKTDCEVTPIIITIKSGEKVIGYLQEMSADLLIWTQDKLIEKPVKYSDIGEAILRDCLLEKESDPRIISEERKNAKIRASFMMASVKLATPYLDEYKKK